MHYCTVPITSQTPIDRATVAALSGLVNKLLMEGEPLLDPDRSIEIYEHDGEVTAAVDDK